MFYLKKISVDDGKDIYEMLQDIEKEENGFHNDAKDIVFAEFNDWLKKHYNYSENIGLPEEWVPQTTFWLYFGEKPVGLGRIRHYLNDTLRLDGGHVGYTISKSCRGNGYGNEILRLLLQECQKLGIFEVHIGAWKDNIRSNKIIIKNGGKLCRENEKKNYYIINNI